MKKLTRNDLMTLEEYAKQRPAFRARVLDHKKPRKISLGDHATLYFEDRLTMQYQIQEMLRVERIFEEEGIMEELNAYNPLIPDGQNLKATFMIEYPDADERKQALEKMIGIEDKVWVKVDDFDKVYAIADEDMERENLEKTSSVHFLRFELNKSMVDSAKKGKPLAMGIDHPAYQIAIEKLPQPSQQALVADFDS
jgi:hypothetical protein